MKVFIITKIIGNDIKFRIVTHNQPFSKIITLKGQAGFFGGNPYSLYGNAIAEYTEYDKFDVSITVCEATSGQL